jgi:hypothetical protein
MLAIAGRHIGPAQTVTNSIPLPEKCLLPVDIRRKSERRADHDKDRMPWKPFIIGVPRSGTTLLRLMLDSHSLLSIPPETQFLSAIVNIKSASVEQTIHAITHCARWNDFGMTEGVWREPHPQTSADAVRRFYGAYAAKQGKNQWGDKTPQYGRIMQRIKTLLPETYFIHIIRDGRDAFVSWRQTHWPTPVSAESGAKMWSSYIREARQQAAAVGDYCEVRYEDLVTNPEDSLSRVCSSIQELGSFRSKRGEVIDRMTRLSWHQRVAKPPDAIRVRRWRTELSSQDRNTYERIAGDLLEELGYMAPAS